MAVNKEALAVAAKLNKDMGEGTVVLASEVRHDLVPRLSTGSLAIDVVLGGGWPANQWNELIGEASAGKTALAMKTLAANQARDPEFTAVWVAAEEWWEPYAIMCGVDTSRVIVVETNVMEEAYESGIRFAESRSVDMLVIDSLPALIPHLEEEKDAGEVTVGKGALLTNQFFRKVGKATKRSLLTQERPFLGLMINQWREKIGVMHGDPRTTPGGKGKDFAYFTRLEVKRDGWITIGPKSDPVKVGQAIKARALKNKSAPPGRVGVVDFYFDDGAEVRPGDFDSGKEIVAVGIYYDIIERKGGWYYYGDKKWQGAPGLVEEVRQDVDLCARITKDVLGEVHRRMYGS